MSGEWATTHVPTSIAGYNVSERYFGCFENYNCGFLKAFFSMIFKSFCKFYFSSLCLLRYFFLWRDLFTCRLGAGAFSVVYKGLSAAPGPNGVRSTVAIKCINMQTANSSKLNSDCVVSEISILKTLKHRLVRILRYYLLFNWLLNSLYLLFLRVI